MKASEVLSRAAGIIAERGWCQHVARRDGGVCAAEAIYQACGRSLPDVEWREVHQAVLAEVESGGRAVPDVISWNDAAETTAEDVMLAFKRAAAALEARGR